MVIFILIDFLTEQRGCSTMVVKHSLTSHIRNKKQASKLHDCGANF